MRKINRISLIMLVAMMLIFLVSSCNSTGSNSTKDQKSAEKEFRFTLVDLPAEKKVEIWIDSELYMNYMYPDNLAKPVLYPIKTASGKVLSRAFPLESVPGERVDHPHHFGMWLNYGDVNGLDFWNNSEAISEEKKSGYGTIFHKEVKNIESGDEEGKLEVVAEWKAPDGTVLLVENTTFIFSAEENLRIIDRTTTLKALDTEVSFKDNKEGMFAMRVSRQMELATDKEAVFIDAHGVRTETKVLDNTGVNGNYLSSEGVEGQDVWATRARWMKLHSSIDDELVEIIIIDHPKNVGYPTYWHARDYGLFAANPLGQSVFSKGENVLNFKLAPQEKVNFKYKVLIHSKSLLSNEVIDAMADVFADE